MRFLTQVEFIALSSGTFITLIVIYSNFPSLFYNVKSCFSVGPINHIPLFYLLLICRSNRKSRTDPLPRCDLGQRTEQFRSDLERWYAGGEDEAAPTHCGGSTSWWTCSQVSHRGVPGISHMGCQGLEMSEGFGQGLKSRLGSQVGLKVRTDGWI